MHIVETGDADAYCVEYADFLGPSPSDNHPMLPMTSVDLDSIQPVDLEQSVADIVLSGAGKIMHFINTTLLFTIKYIYIIFQVGFLFRA